MENVSQVSNFSCQDVDKTNIFILLLLFTFYENANSKQSTTELFIRIKTVYIALLCSFILCIPCILDVLYVLCSMTDCKLTAYRFATPSTKKLPCCLVVTLLKKDNKPKSFPLRIAFKCFVLAVVVFLSLSVLHKCKQELFEGYKPL